LPGWWILANAELFSSTQLPDVAVTGTVTDLALSRLVTFSMVPTGNWLLDAAGEPPSPESVTVEPQVGHQPLLSGRHLITAHGRSP